VRNMDASTPLLKSSRDKASRASRAWVTVGGGVGVGVVGLLAFGRLREGLGTSGGQWRPGHGHPLLAPKPTPSQQHMTRTFTLHTQCMDRETKLGMAEFFYTGAPEGYLVRHNYGSTSFFEHHDALQMERVVLDSEERAWRVTTNDVNFEYGFAFRNPVTGKWRKEIGSYNSPLAKQPCVQMYGKYFNRVATLEKTADIHYVYGLCNTTCPEGFVETQWVDQPLSDDVPVGAEEQGLDLGEGDDARLITIRTALPLKADGQGPSGRALVQRDKRFAETEDVSRWIMAIVDPYPASEMKLAMLEVVKSSTDRLSVRQIASKRYSFGHTCSRTECSVAKYDVSAIWHDHDLSSFSYNFWATKLQYTIARKGDTKVPSFEHAFPDSAFISTTNVWTMKSAGTWGRDIDVRRVVFTSAGVCGSSWEGRCLRMGAVERAYFEPHTATEAHWIATLDGGGKGAMAMIKVYTDAAGNLLAKVTAGREGSQCTDPPRIGGSIRRTAWLRQWDKLQCTIPLQTRWNGATVRTVKNSATDSRVIGVGALAYLLAPEMTASLAASFNDPATSTR
jgi:hypothetical protein